MRFALLVAMREFAENAKTKGFWISILSFPVILMVAMAVTRFLEEKGTPTRHYVLIDQSGQYESVVLEALGRYQVFKDLGALRSHQTKYAKEGALPEQPDIDFEKISAEALNPDAIIQQFGQDNPEMIDAIGSPEMWDMMVEKGRELMVEDAPPLERPRVAFQRVDLPDGIDPAADIDEIAAKLREYLKAEKMVDYEGEQKELFAAILIPADVDSDIRVGTSPEDMTVNRDGIQYWSINLADDDLKDQVSRAVNSDIRSRKYQESGMSEEEVRDIEKTRLPVAQLDPKKKEGEEVASAADVLRQWAPIGFVYLLWAAIITVAQMLLNNTIEEKSNRIVEVLLSSVTPGELMAGKLIGIAAVGLVMQVCWVLSMIGVFAFKAGPEAEWAVRQFDVISSPELLIAFGGYFLFGYLFYAGIFLSIGSICNTIKDAQNYMGLVMVVMMVPLLTMMFIPKDPHGTLATVLSWIPFYTPFVMMNRMAADPPMFDILGTGILMLLSTGGILWLSGRIFRVGILRTGQPPKLKELLAWMKAGN